MRLGVGIVMMIAPAVARADDPIAGATSAATSAATEPSAGNLAIHAQATFTVQATPGFAAPYAGANSLQPHQARETFDATVYAGVRLWHGAEIWINGEIDQGFGLSNTLGAAGYPSGEAYKVGKATPYGKMPRLFVRQTIGLGGGQAPVAAAANQFAGHQASDRLVLTVGKFGVVDVFDTNGYAHDPRGDYLNWSVIDAGAFDYAANAWGFTFGGAAELYTGAWTIRSGLFDLSKLPNQPALETGFQQYQVVSEIEHRHAWHGHAGAIRFGGWFTRGNLALLRDVIAVHDHTGMTPDNATVRRMHDHAGGYLNVEQDLGSGLGMFARASAADGVTESDDFTDIDRSIAVGGTLSGGRWGRARDRAGIAGVINAISRTRQIFLADGGLGTLVGDGRLPHPGNEAIVETWYQVELRAGLTATLDYQVIVNPAYNRDRGPVHVFGLRLHAGV